jgi:hypothetical protein
MNKEFQPTGDLFLDTDSDPKSTQGSDFILNTMVTLDSRGKVSVNCLGNESVYTIQGHIGIITMLGSCADNARNRIIMFFIDDQHDSIQKSIQYYEPFTGNSGIILSGINLSFDANHPIYNPKVVGDLLYWTDNFVEPKKINYIRAYNYTNGISTSYTYTYMNIRVTDAYKRPGINFYVTPLYGTTDKLRGKSYQWAYRNIFVDGEKSVLSDYTTIYFTDINSYPNGGVDKNGIGVVGYQLYAPIDVVNNDITSVEVYVRDNEASNWFLYDTVLNPTGSFTYVFDDKNLRIQADQTDLSRPFDFMPQLAKHQELIEKNRIIYGNITEGFDPVTVDATVDIITKNSQLWDQAPTGGNVSIGIGGGYIAINYDTYAIGVLYGVEILEFNSATNAYQIYNGRYISVVGDTPTNILSGLRDTLTSNGLTAVSVGTVSGILRLLIQSVTGTKTRSFRRFFSYLPNKTPFKSLKKGDTVLGSIKYYNKNLQFGSENKFAQPIDIPLYSPPPTPEINMTNGYVSLSVSISNQPPVGAYFYSVDFTERIHIGYNIQLVCIPLDDYFFDATDKNLRIRVNALINDARIENPYLNLSNYIFEKGDRLRVIGYASALLGYNIMTTPNKVLDLEIQGMEWPNSDAKYSKDQATSPAYITDANGNKVLSDLSSYVKINITQSDLSDFTDGFGIFVNQVIAGQTWGGDSLMIEIYRPKKVSENPFYFPNIVLPIGNPGTSSRYHTGTIQNQSSSVPAIVECNPGDTYTKIRDVKDIFVCQEDNYSDYYDSNFHGNGKPNIYDINAKRANYQSAMRYSELLIENTRTNNLNQFLNNFTNLKSEFGAINSIREVGDVLKVLQDKKETSIYVGKEEVNTAGGQRILMANPNLVLGNQNRADELRGTTNNHSVVVHDRNMYYWDGLRKEVIRSAPNGQEPISEYMMKTFFKTMTDYTDVIAGFDQQNNMYLISFIGGASPVTLGFIEPKLEGERPKWISFFSFVPQNYLSMGNFFSSFIGDNSIWKHNSTSVARCSFYGVKYDQQINLIFNKAGAVKKLFRNIGLKTNKRWSIPTITIEADESYPRGFLSKIPAGRFKLKEGDMFSEYLKNMFTHSSTPSNLDLINGNELRGFYIKHELVNSEDEETWILGVQIGFDVSNNY